MSRSTILLAAAWLIAMPGTAAIAATRTATECVDAASTALQKAYVALGSPGDPGMAALEKVVDGAKPDLRKLVWGDPDVRVTTSVLEGKIRIWAHCGGKELWRDWVPPR